MMPVIKRVFHKQPYNRHWEKHNKVHRLRSSHPSTWGFRNEGKKRNEIKMRNNEFNFFLSAAKDFCNWIS